MGYKDYFQFVIIYYKKCVQTYSILILLYSEHDFLRSSLIYNRYSINECHWILSSFSVTLWVIIQGPYFPLVYSKVFKEHIWSHSFLSSNFQRLWEMWRLLNQSLPRCILFSLELQDTRYNSNKNAHVWLCFARLKLLGNPVTQTAWSLDTWTIRKHPGKCSFICLTSLLEVQILLSIKNVKLSFLAWICHLFARLSSFTEIITNYKTCKAWSRLYDTHIKMLVI